MKNNKGMSITEIIISITLISIVLVFLINALITIKSANEKQTSSSNLLINRALIIKEIQKDFMDYDLVGVSTCTTDDMNLTGAQKIIPTGANNIYCLKLTYDNTKTEDNTGYLLQYAYNYSDTITKYVAGYKRGKNQIIRETENLMDPSINGGTVTSSCSNEVYSACSLNIELPIIDNNDRNYKIELNYIYNSNNFTYTKGSDYGFTIS